MVKTVFTMLLISCLCAVGRSQTNEGLSSKLKEQSIDSSMAWMKANLSNEAVFDQFLTVGQSTLNRSLEVGIDSTSAQIHELIASWHAYNGLYSSDSTVFHAEKALEYHLKGNDQRKIAASYRSIAIDYLNIQDLQKAQEALFKSIEIYESLNDEAGLGSAYRTLGVLFRVMEDYEKSIFYTEQAIPLLQKAEDYVALAIAQFNLIIGYGKLGEYEKAYEAAAYCLQLIEEKAPKEVFIAVRAHSFRGEVYLKAGDSEKALRDYIEAFELCKSQVGEERCSSYRTDIGKIYLLLENYDQALSHLLAGVNALEEKEQKGLVEPYLDLATCYAQLGDYKNALVYQQKANANSERMLNETIANMKSEMAIKYETVKKDEELASQAALLAQKNKVQVLIIIAAALLLVLLLSLLYFFHKNKKTTQVIRAKNSENELLLKEIHHRVKNNLELVKSLLSLQSAQIEDPATKEAMLASKNRVQSMGIIHQKLYQGTNLGSIEMKDYFLNLSEEILDSFNAEDKVRIECAMDAIELDVDTAVPIGLIVNELLTNALKYAFPPNEQGTIQISLEKAGDHNLLLKVADDGVGKKEGVGAKGTGFGSQLVELLTQQLNGKMKEHTHNGTQIEFNFYLKTSA